MWKSSPTLMGDITWDIQTPCELEKAWNISRSLLLVCPHHPGDQNIAASSMSIHWIPVRTTSHLSIYSYSSFRICQRCHHRVLILPLINIAIHLPCVIHPSSIRPLRHCSCYTLVSDIPQPHTQQSLCLQDELPSTLSHLRRDLPSMHSDRFRMALAYSFTHCSPFLAFMLY